MISSIEALYEACEYLDVNAIQKVINDIRINLSNMKKYHLYSEYFVCIDYIQKHFVNDENLSKEELLKLIKYIKLWDNKLSSLLTEIVEKNNRNYLLDQEIFSLMKPFYNQNDVISKYWYADNKKNEFNYAKALEIYEELGIYFQNRNNEIRNIQVKVSVFNIYRDIDHEKAEECTKEIWELAKSTKISKKSKNANYYNLGMYHYLNGNYKNAYECYSQAYNLIPKEKTLLFVCACKRRLEIKLEKFELNDGHVLYPYLRYFQMISLNTSEKELEEYIMNSLMKLLINDYYVQPFWAMYQYEIIKLSKITKNYSKVVTYQEKLAKATKSTV